MCWIGVIPCTSMVNYILQTKVKEHLLQFYDKNMYSLQFKLVHQGKLKAWIYHNYENYFHNFITILCLCKENQYKHSILGRNIEKERASPTLERFNSCFCHLLVKSRFIEN